MEQWYNPNFAEEQFLLSEEKKQIRKASNRCGIVMIILLASLYILSFGIGIVGALLWRFLPNDFTSMFSFADIANLILNLVFYVVISPLLMLYCNMRSGTKLSEYLRFPAMPAKSVWKLILMGIGVVGASSQAGGWVYQGINNILRLTLGIEMRSPDVTVDRNLISVVLLIVSTAIFAPIFEELLARCGLLGTLKAHGGVFASIATGIMFGFMHTNFQQVFFATAMGIYAGFMVYRTRSIWPAIILHFSINMISVLQVIALSFTDISEETLDILTLMEMEPQQLLIQIGLLGVVSLLSLLLMVLGIIGLVYLIKEIIRYPHEFTLPQEQKRVALRTRDKCRIFLTSPGIIIFLSLSIFLSFLNAFVLG